VRARRLPSLLLGADHIAPRVLRYVKSAVGETDVPDRLPEFINQRRRWLNGSFFAATYAIAHIGQMLSSGHSVSRKIALSIQTFYNAINLIASWFAIVSTIGE
jgi:chitin synthase